jgi:hypothetical protein
MVLDIYQLHYTIIDCEKRIDHGHHAVVFDRRRPLLLVSRAAVMKKPMMSRDKQQATAPRDPRCHAACMHARLQYK